MLFINKLFNSIACLLYFINLQLVIPGRSWILLYLGRTVYKRLWACLALYNYHRGRECGIVIDSGVVYTEVWHMLMIIKRYTFNHSNTWNLQKPFQRLSYLGGIGGLICALICWIVGTTRSGLEDIAMCYGDITITYELWWISDGFRDIFMTFYLSKTKLFGCLVWNNCFIIYFDGVFMYFSEFQNFIKLLSGSKVFY